MLCLAAQLVSCGSDNPESKHYQIENNTITDNGQSALNDSVYVVNDDLYPDEGKSVLNDSVYALKDYFYPVPNNPIVYVYRDMIGGLDEQFHRIYSVSDHAGKHIVIERYASDGRILEALNFNVDSLDVQDHMVVNRNQKKTKAILYKTSFFPLNSKSSTWFASKFEGVRDSTLILQELRRTVSGFDVNRVIMGNETPCLSLLDKTQYTEINPFSKTQKTFTELSTSYYQKGFGLVEWVGKKNKVHFKLERIMTQNEWVRIIRR
jgi:hypothetical protein